MAIIRGGQYGDACINNSGATRAVGDVVIQDTTGNQYITTTATEAHLGVVGVVVRGGLASAYVRVASTGVVQVKVDGATSRGNFLVTSTTATRATPKASYQNGAFARALSSSAGLGTIWAELLFPVPTINMADHSSRHEDGGADEISVAGLSGQLADVQAATLNAVVCNEDEVVCHNNNVVYL